jgi:hypothetical protein
MIRVYDEDEEQKKSKTRSKDETRTQRPKDGHEKKMKLTSRVVCKYNPTPKTKPHMSF